MGDRSAVRVIVDDRIRLLSAALAGTDYPDRSQQRKRHRAHSHARTTQRYLHDNGLNTHPAVQMLQHLLNQGVPLDTLFTVMMLHRFPNLDAPSLPRWVPEHFGNHLRDFYDDANLEGWWQNADPAWQEAVQQSAAVISDAQFRPLLEQFIGPIEREFIFVPNVSYPADVDLGVQIGDYLMAIIPPPQAWGDSPPWPYDDESMMTTTVGAALSQYSRLVLSEYLSQHPDSVADASQKALPVNESFKQQHPTWQDQFVALFSRALVAMYLEEYVSETEARSYMVMEKKAHGMSILPGTVNVLQRFLQEQGNRYDTLAEFLSLFPSQLRIAKRMVTL